MKDKLFKIKKEIGKMTKDKTNPFHNSKYFDINGLLDHVGPMLEKENILLLQPLEGNKVTTKLIDLEDGTEQTSSLEIPGGETNPQKIGSMITYFRRYTLASLLAIQAEDDDANKASGYSSPKKEVQPAEAEPEKWLNVTLKGSDEMTKEFENVLKGISEGKIKSLRDVRQVYKVSKTVAEEIEKALTK